MQVYRLEYPGKIPVVFNLALEDGKFVDVPEFYLYKLTDVNDRTTFYIDGKYMLVVGVCSMYRVGQKSKPAYFCNNSVYCQPIFIIFGTYTH